MRTGRLLAALPLLLVAAIGWAEPSITAKVSANDMTLDSSITLLLEVQGVKNVGSAPNLQLPDFQVQPAGQTSSFQWINGQSSSLITFNYVLSPTKTGELTIPSLSLQIDGKTYSTQPLTVTVRASGGGSNGNSSGASTPSKEPASQSVAIPAEGLKPVFMTASVDTNKVYVGQQIVLKVLFLHRPDVQFASQARYSEPDLAGFLVEPLDKQDYTTTINGTRYDVTEIPYALFPTSDGELTIGAAQVELAVRTEADPFDPNSFFQNFFGRAQVARLNTRAIPIHVRSLPIDKPAAFSGAVGRYKISSKVDTDQFEVGKPFNLLVTIDGVGNVKALKEPTLPELKGFRRYETISSSKISKEGKFIHGSKEFKILLIPQVSGQLTIPAVPFSYFNPAKSSFETTSSGEITISVKPGTINPDEPRSPATSAAQQPGESVRVLERDIRFIKNGRINPLQAPIYQRVAFYVLLFLPVLFAGAALIVRLRSSHRLENSGFYRSKDALHMAKRKLKNAASQLNASDPEPFYRAVQTAVAGFLADKFGLSTSGLRWEDVEQKLAAAKVPPALIKSVRDIFDQADMARFATSSFSEESRSQVLAHAKDVLTGLEKYV
jgi:hypothetical protein